MIEILPGRSGGEADFVPICPEQVTDVTIIGGGLAGVWTGYHLVKAGVATTIVMYKGGDRGGILGASRKSAGAFNTFILGREYPQGYLNDLGRGQMHPCVEPTLRKYLQQGIEDLKGLTELKPVKIGLALESGSGEEFLQTMYERFLGLGGRIVDGWVTRIVADQQTCSGVQYESGMRVGKIRCRAVVIASGGYAGLFGNAIKSNCFGNVLGNYLRAGGIATNLEFLFKHGYGNVDANALTPTEELPGAEIYDHQHQRVNWLEELLYHKQGTKTHLQAVQFWLRNPEREFYVDLSYRKIYERVWQLNELINAAATVDAPVNSNHEELIESLLQFASAESRSSVSATIFDWVREKRTIGYNMFEQLKPNFPRLEGLRFRVRPLTYFSMGGVGHVDFATNLKNVFVTGEAMHDFGANRVGGLPWSLYLAGAYVIAPRIQAALQEANKASDFELDQRLSKFDGDLLRTIQTRLYECHDRELSASRAVETINWLRIKRREIVASGANLDDAVNWLLVGEAIMQASLCRRESRGFFFRFDYQTQDPELDRMFSCARYNHSTDQMEAVLAPWHELASIIGQTPTIGSRELTYEPAVQCC